LPSSYVVEHVLLSPRFETKLADDCGSHKITLLAGSLATLTDILGGTDATAEEDTKGIKGLRLILWIAIMSDVAEAFLCIMAIKMCVELPLVAMEKQVGLLENAIGADGPGDIERNLTISPKQLRHRHEILEAVGMPRSYRYIDRLVIWFLLWSVGLSIAAMFYWVGQTVNIFPAGVIIIFFGLIAVMLLIVFVIVMKFSRKWR